MQHSKGYSRHSDESAHTSCTDLLRSNFVFLCVYSSYAEQLVLYMKAEEFLSSALHTAKENIKQGQLLASATVKQGETTDLWFRTSCTLFFLCVALKGVKRLSFVITTRSFWETLKAFKLQRAEA